MGGWGERQAGEFVGRMRWVMRRVLEWMDGYLLG